MNAYLGIDTSNYTTSAALYLSSGEVIHSRRLLPVKEGQKGLRQSEALFQHIKALPEIVTDLFSGAPEDLYIKACGVSAKPRDEQGSYMPCFLAGVSAAHTASEAMRIPCYEFSHQAGHIAAALLSSGNTDLLHESFFAFHVSGGTTDVLEVRPGSGMQPFAVRRCGGSEDLNAGQAIDRAGVMLGLDFPCGKELEKLALQSEENYDRTRVCVHGCSCSLSGLENKCSEMKKNDAPSSDIALFCLSYIRNTLVKMTLDIRSRSDSPVIFAGGVMSDGIIRKGLSGIDNVYFAKPEFSCDNAAGTAYLASLADEGND